MIMERKTLRSFRFPHLRIILALLLCAAGSWMAIVSFAAEPSSGTLSETTPTLEYTAGPFVQSNPVPIPLLEAGPTCGGVDTPCDSYELTVSTPAAFVAANPSAVAKVSLSWTDTGSGQADYDLYIYEGKVDSTSADTPVAHRGASKANPEVASIFPLKAGDTVYTIKVVPYTATGETIRVKIELQAGNNDGPAPTGFPGFGTADPTVPGNPRYHTYIPPKGTSAEANSGEMNIGFNPATGRFMLNNIGPVWRVTPPEVAAAGAPECCNALWEERNSIVADTGVDPILWTDQPTGRTFVSNFTGGPNGLYAYTDSDGEPTPTQPTGYVVVGAGLPTGGADHQTIGSGPYPAALSALANPVNKGRAVYYCTQGLVGPGFCQRSDDLGQSYGPGTLAYTGADCSGLHGHIRVGPDGAAYLPVPDCGGKAGVSVSTNGGVTWKEFFLPNSLPQSAGSDSSIAIDADNNLYYFYIVSSPDATLGTMHVQVGKRIFNGAGELVDIEWSKDTDLGASHGILNSAFPEAIAGDSGRAAMGFIGTDRPGDFQSLAFPGYWYAFMSTTFDGGNTWVTTNVSPNDPVQGKGGVWQQGGSAENRNLLDFNEITIDNKGRPVFGFSDGCVGDCVQNPDNNTFVAHMRMARQSGGRTLFASQDAFNDGPNAPIAPKAPCLSGTRDINGSHLRWVAPDNGGADIVYYKIFRGTSPGNLTLLTDTGSAALPNTKTSFDDTTADPAVEHYYYAVQAVNSQGASVRSNELDLIVSALPAVETECALPGITLVTDPSNDSLNTLGSTDVQQLSFAELYDPASSVNKLYIRLKMRDLSSLPPETRWVVRFTRADGAGTTEYFVSMLNELPAAASGPVFRYGHVEVGAGGTQSNVTDGNIDKGTFSADGTILFEISQPTKTGTGANNRDFPPLQTGEAFSNVNVVVFQKVGVSLQQMDSTSAGTYTLKGNLSCKPAVGPGPGPLPKVAQLLNISTRVSVQRDDQVGIGGFIVNGTTPKRVVVRAIGPSLQSGTTGLAGRLEDPTLELYNANNDLLESNDNWRTNEAAITPTQLAPTNDAESAIVRVLEPGNYTAIVRGANNTTGIALIEAYDLDNAVGSQLRNISTRGLVQLGDNVLIGGFILGAGDAQNIVVRAIGPELTNRGVPGALQDPLLELRNSNGVIILANDNWKDLQQAELQASGLAPTDDREAAIIRLTNPGNYTAIVRGKAETSGVGLVEVYSLTNP